MPGGMACSTPVWYCAKDSKKLLKKLSVTSKVSITVQKNLFKLMVGEEEEVTRDVKWNSVSPWKKKMFSLVFIRVKWNESRFCLNLLIYICFYVVFPCADVSFCMISFRGSVYITFITRNEISFL